MASSKSSRIDDLECIHLHPQCSACNAVFSRDDDHVIALICNEKSVRGYNAYAGGFYRPRELPRPKGVWFSQEGFRHKTCNATGESVTVHVDCIRLFSKTCSARDKFRRLWTAGTRMYPWRDSESLMLDPVLYAPADIISSVAGSHETLLPEVAGLIGGHLQPNHPLLRFCKVMQLARYLSLAEPGDSVTYPLYEVLSWSRGTLPILAEQGQPIDRRVRLTIDSRGIKSIDMVSEKSEESAVIGSSRSSHAYIVGSVESLSGVGIEFQLGMSRLHVPASANVSIWNIPSPNVLPPSAHYTYTSSDKSLPGRLVPRRFAALDLDPSKTTGISFLLKGAKVSAIHGHTKRGSQALEAFQYMRRSWNSAVWFYIPIAANDKVISIGTVRVKRDLTMVPRHKMLPIVIAYSIVLTMKSGKYVIGLPYTLMYSYLAEFVETLYEMPESEDRHLTLTYSISNPSHITFIGTDTAGKVVSGLEPRPPGASPAFHFCASLERVVYAQVFSDRDTGRCSGILLEYEDGIKRALGQCRFGFDDVQCYEHPTKFCYMPITYPGAEPLCLPRKHVHAAFDTDAGPFVEQDTAKWKICPLKGVLHYLFGEKDTEIKVCDA